MITSDRAINNQDEDRLDRVNFARNLAKEIIEFKGSESLVFALYGAWGSGKTSVINLIAKYITQHTEDWDSSKRPIIVWFNPWNISDKDQMLGALFQQVYAELSKVIPKAKRKQLREALVRFSKAIGALEIVPKIGEYIKFARGVAHLVLDEKSIKQQREDIDKLFRSLDRRIIIIIDDIDRLSKDEIQLLFQIIKMNADFPNTTFLTAFDRRVVESALSTEQGISGRDYLEKIVQIGFNLPTIESERIYEVLIDNLDSLIDKNKVSIDEERWGKLFHSGFKDLFVSLRAVKRYTNSLEMTLNMINGEVNTVDFFGLEATRLFLPNLYNFIAENKSVFLMEAQIWNAGENEFEKIKNTINEALQSDGKELIAKSLIQFLFPQLEKMYSNQSYGTDYILQWRKEKRICANEFFDAYFLFGIPRGSISQNELDQFIMKIEDEEIFDKLLQKYIDEDKFRKLIRRLEDRLDKLTMPKCKILIEKFIHLISSLPPIYEKFFDLGSDRAQILLIKKLLQRIDEGERLPWFRELILRGSPLYPTVMIIDDEFANQIQPRTLPLFSLDQLDDLKALSISKLSDQAMDLSLFNQKGASFLFYRWRAWETDQKKIEGFVKKILSNITILLDFSRVFTYEEKYIGERKEIVMNIDRQGLSQFITNDVLIESLNALSEQEIRTLNKEQLEVMELLLEKKIENS